MDPALISAIFAGATGLVAALAAALTNRQRKVATDVEQLEDEVHALRTQLESAIVHIYDLRRDLAAANVPLPPMPDELTVRHAKRSAS